MFSRQCSQAFGTVLGIFYFRNPLFHFQSVRILVCDPPALHDEEDPATMSRVILAFETSSTQTYQRNLSGLKRWKVNNQIAKTYAYEGAFFNRNV